MATYFKNSSLSREALGCALLIFNMLKEKTQREGKIPSELLFWTHGDMPEAEQELIDAGYQEYAFTDKDGTIVYRHIVDKELLREALAWDKQ